MFRILLVFIQLALLPGFSEVFFENQKKVPEVLLHFKTADASEKSIRVKIPSHFVLLVDQCDEKEKNYEFIPEGESPNRWNEIITILQWPNHGKNLSQFLKTMQSQYISNKQRCSISFGEENGVKIGFLYAELPACFPCAANTKPIMIAGKKELFCMKVAEEAHGFSVVQFSKRYPDTFSKDEKEAVKEKMFDYLKSCEIR